LMVVLLDTERFQSMLRSSTSPVDRTTRPSTSLSLVRFPCTLMPQPWPHATGASASTTTTTTAPARHCPRMTRLLTRMVRRSLYELHPLLPVAHLADHPRLVVLLSQLPYDAVRVVIADDHHEADAHVEHAVHLRLVHVPQPLQPVEDRRPLPLLPVDR